MRRVGTSNQGRVVQVINWNDQSSKYIEIRMSYKDITVHSVSEWNPAYLQIIFTATGDCGRRCKHNKIILIGKNADN